MGSVGDAYVNRGPTAGGWAESFFSTLQTELLDTKAWRTRAELRTAVFEYIEGFYNRQRRHSGLEYMTPMEYEREHERKQSAASD